MVLIEPVSGRGGPRRILGYDVKPVADIAARSRRSTPASSARPGDTALNLDDRDLVDYADAAGFRQIDCSLRADVRAARPPCPWERFLRSSPNRTLPPFGEVLNYLLPRPRQPP